MLLEEVGLRFLALRGSLEDSLVASVVLACASFVPVAGFVLASAVGLVAAAALSRGLPALSERPGSVTFGMRMRGIRSAMAGDPRPPSRATAPYHCRVPSIARHKEIRRCPKQ